MPRHLPGNPTMIPNFRPGAGGALAASYMANLAPRDGLHISLILANAILVSVLTPDEARFDGRQFQWIGSMFHRTGVVWLYHTAPATTLDDAKKVEVVLGASGIGSETFQTPRVMNALLGTRFKIVTGYRSGAEINLAIDRGEVHGRQQNHLGWEAAGKQDWVTERKVIPIVQTGQREPALGKVPLLVDLVQPGLERSLVELHEIGGDIGMAVFAPPGVPADRVAALRQAFEQTMKDPVVLEEARKRLFVIAPKTGEEVRRIVDRAYSYPREVNTGLRDILTLSRK
jgi:tripartite-type tricarboxylate transporter receptor subunit TctC